MTGRTRLLASQTSAFVFFSAAKATTTADSRNGITTGSAGLARDRDAANGSAEPAARLALRRPGRRPFPHPAPRI